MAGLFPEVETAIFTSPTCATAGQNKIAQQQGYQQSKPCTQQTLLL